MKTLTIIRHAKSDWSYDLPDHDRPLNKRGKSDLPLVAARLKQLNVDPDICYHSSAVRATDTANGLLDYMGCAAKRSKSKALYTFDEVEVIEFLKALGNDKSSVMIVGHNPGFTDLINVLSNTRLDNLPTCGFAQLTFDTNLWAELDEVKGKLVFLEYPKMI